MASRMMRVKWQIFISMSWFTINNSFRLPISSSLNTSIQKGQLPISLTFYGELYRIIEGSIELKCCKRTTTLFSGTAKITSSTNRFQNEGLTGAVVGALCSISSITKLAMTAETSEPIAVPKTCMFVISALKHKLSCVQTKRQ